MSPRDRGRIKETAKARKRGLKARRKGDIVNHSHDPLNSVVSPRLAPTVRDLKDVFTDIREVSAKTQEGGRFLFVFFSEVSMPPPHFSLFFLLFE